MRPLPPVEAEEFQEKSAMKPSSSLPSLSVERIDQLRCQIGWLKAERKAEKEQLRKLEHSLSECTIAERKAHERAQRQREKRKEHEKHIKSLEHKIYEVKRPTSSSDPRTSGAFRQADSPSNHAATVPKAHVAAGSAGVRAVVSPQSPMSTVDNAFECVPQDAMGSSAPSHDVGKSRQLVVVAQDEGEVEKVGTSQTRVDLKISADMFDSEAELAQHRRDVVRKEMMAKAERRRDPTGQLLNGEAVTYFEMKLGLLEYKLHDDELQEYWKSLETVERGNILDMFKLINMNGSGRICSQEFADGVARIGVKWQKLTGLKKPKDLFRLFDQDKDGVITLFELFPTERHTKKDDTGSTTPEFWKIWNKKNLPEEFFFDDPKGRHPPWNTGVADDGLAILKERDSKDAEAAFMRKWMQTTMRRMKGRGKSDARCREMCCLHLPRGTGTLDRQGVATFSDVEVKQCKREYNDAVMEPQRMVLKALFDLRETRKELSSSRHNLWHVSMEPILRQKALEEKNNIAKNALGGLNLHIHEDHDEAPDEEEDDDEAPDDDEDET
jgi:hypothetical protein